MLWVALGALHQVCVSSPLKGRGHFIALSTTGIVLPGNTLHPAHHANGFWGRLMAGQRSKAEIAAMNRLYYGDNLDILRNRIDSDSVDLC